MIITNYSYRAGARLTLLPSTDPWIFGLEIDETEIDTEPAADVSRETEDDDE